MRGQRVGELPPRGGGAQAARPAGSLGHSSLPLPPCFLQLVADLKAPERAGFQVQRARGEDRARFADRYLRGPKG